MANTLKFDWVRWISPIFIIATVIFGGGSIHKTIKDSNKSIQANTTIIQANTQNISQNTMGIAIDMVEDLAFQKSVDIHIQHNNEMMKELSADVKTLLLKGDPL